ncbi:hypothetical protein LNV09_22190 [Paucibacter sp. B2R-40]|nr:hypothetical protein [Paucibacter sp. B2R-40]
MSAAGLQLYMLRPIQPVLLEQRQSDLAQPACAQHIHQHLEDIFVGDDGLLQAQ